MGFFPMMAKPGVGENKIPHESQVGNFTHPLVQGVWILAKFVKSVIHFYTFDKSKHLEVSDSILGHSQVF